LALNLKHIIFIITGKIFRRKLGTDERMREKGGLGNLIKLYKYEK
jgi:hypothetical protein